MSGPTLHRIDRPAFGCGCGRASAGRRACRHLPLVPALALLLLPKCPVCFAAWLGVFGSLGADSWVFDLYGTPLTLALLSFALVALAVRAVLTGDVRPMLLGSVGAIAATAGRCVLETPTLTYAGLAVLSAAVVWGSRPGPRPVTNGGDA